MKLLKHMLPGNHLLSEPEESKIGARHNRYGVAGDNGYSQIVEIQRLKQEPKKKPQQQVAKPLTKEETKKVKEHLVNKVKDMSQKLDLEVKQTNDEEEADQVSEPEYDVVP